MANDKLIKDVADILARLHALEARLTSLEGAVIAIAMNQPVSVKDGRVAAVDKSKYT